MSDNLSVPERFKVQCLILLVGSNPLPNWVAAKLLLAERKSEKDQESAIWLLHSDGSGGEPNTSGVALKIKESLASQLFPGINIDQTPIHLEGIPSSDALGIQKRLDSISQNWKGAQSIGLNYTGGTKPMAVHVYRYLETKAREDRSCLFGIPIHYSYLDPRQTKLRIEGRDDAEFSLLEDDDLRQLLTISLKELAALHGYEPPFTNTDRGWNTSPEITQLAREIGKVYAQGGVPYNQWRKWLKPPPTLPPTIDKYDAIEGIIACMDVLGGGANQPQEEKAKRIAAALIKNAAQINGKTSDQKEVEFKSTHGWFGGAWLEDCAFASLLEAAELLGIADTETGRNLVFHTRINGTDADKFELDCAAIKGYQLFALSCCSAGTPALDETTNKNDCQTTTEEPLEGTGKARLKEHLIEGYVRARQLGGDEARIGLVSFYPEAEKLELELRRSWDMEGKIKVFTLKDFSDLTTAFVKWIRGGM